MAQEQVVDHEARNMASLALQRISDHEDRCGERWEEQRKAVSELSRTVATGFSATHSRITAIILLALTTALAVAGSAAWYVITK